MRFPRKRGATSARVRVFIPDNSVATGAGCAGLTYASTNLAVAYSRENDNGGTEVTGANLLTISTIGTWADPGAGKLRFAPVDAAKFPGLYEIHFPDAAAFGTGDTSQNIIISVYEKTTTALKIGPNMVMIPLSAMAVLDGESNTIQLNGTAQTAGDVLGTWTPTKAGYVDAAVSTRSTYGGGDTSGVTTLLSRLTDARAGYLDALNGIVAAIWGAATRTLTAISDSSGITTLLSRILGTLDTGTHKPQSGDAYARLGANGAGLTAIPDSAGVTTMLADYARRTGDYATAAALASLQANVTTLLSRIVGTLAAGTHNPQSGDAYARVGSGGAGLTALVSVLATIDGLVEQLAEDYVAPNNAGIAAIKAKTDNLPADPADESAIESALDLAVGAIWDELVSSHTAAGSMGERLGQLADAGDGGVVVPVTVTDDDAMPLEGVEVWVSTDEPGESVCASGATNALGIVNFLLDAGTYYVWKQLAGYNFTNPETLEVT